MLEKFFHHCERKLTFVPAKTFLLVPEIKSDGSCIIVTKCLESLSDPLSSLKFTDFDIQKCVENGVTYKSLGITKDMRVGFESECEALESRFNEIENRIFVESSKTE